MLEIWACSEPGKKSELFLQADPRGDTWVVADLQSKWHVQKKWLDRYGALEQSSVVRATELWRQLGFQLEPDLRMVSQELAQSLIWSWVEPRALPWARTPQSVSEIQKQMNAWISVFSHDGHRDVMAEWFAANPRAVERWGHWYVLCSELWDWFSEKKWMLKEWLPGWLAGATLERVQWPKRLIFDLGAQITHVEGQLIQQISRYLDVVVIYPDADWLELMPDTLRPYEPMVGPRPKSAQAWSPAVGPHLTFGRFTTQLAEAKDAVAQVRIWLERGVAPDRIAIVAPDIEAYWPALRLICEQEGVPTGKNVTAKFGGFSELSGWISALRTAVGRVKTADLELTLFGLTESPRMPVAEFRRLFTHVYGPEDLGRVERLFESASARPPESELFFRDFLAWALALWPEQGGIERLESLVGMAVQEVPESLRLPAREWLSYLEGLLARREVILKRGTDGGVWCVSLSSAHWVPATHAVFLNLNEGALRCVDRSPVSAADVQAVLRDTGFALGSADRQQLEFEMIWFWQKSWTELRLTFAAHDFQGRVLTPSRLWMWTAIENGKFNKAAESPRLTRWDEIQLMLASGKIEEGGPSDGLAMGLKRDIDGGISTWSREDGGSFSASRLEQYWRCPFIFAAQKRLGLNDDPALDLDLDHRTRGLLLHAMLEKLTEEPMRFSWSDEALDAVIEECRAEVGAEVADARLWPPLKARHLRLARAFLDFERQWRARFPHTETVARELSVEGHWDISTGGPSHSKTPLRYSGRIDRVDRDSQGRYAVLDYKSGANGLRNWPSWRKNSAIQLAFYSLLVEGGWTTLPEGEVAAANYYVIRDCDRGAGFAVRDESAELYELAPRARSAITREEKSRMFEDVKADVNEALRGIADGRLDPCPREVELCTTCAWRKQCRASHLN